jgi:hypothetical protein
MKVMQLEAMVQVVMAALPKEAEAAQHAGVLVLERYLGFQLELTAEL